MAKADKATVLSRIHDVVRLLLAGAEFADIRQYASDHCWQVSDRQVRRYQEAAYKRLARATKRNRDQLLGRHLTQRRALYARSLKGNDLRTALQVLRDEAALQGLYPPNKIAPTTPDGEQPYAGPNGCPLPRRERVVRLLAAEAREDKAEMRLVEHITPRVNYQVPDTRLPVQALHMMAIFYVSEQLEYAAMVVNAMACQVIEAVDDGSWMPVGLCNAHRFRVGREGWRQFTREIGVDGDFLVKSNYKGTVLGLFEEKICSLAPSAEELRELLHDRGLAVSSLSSADSLAKSWHQLFAQICPA